MKKRTGEEIDTAHRAISGNLLIVVEECGLPSLWMELADCCKTVKKGLRGDPGPTWRWKGNLRRFLEAAGAVTLSARFCLQR